MRKRAALLTALFIALAPAAFSQSLADLANKEKERRQEIGNDKVITDQEAFKYRNETPPAATSDKPAAKPENENSPQGPETASSSEKGNPDEPADFEGRPESYWRKTMTEAREKVKNLENEANVIVLKINDLQTKFYNEDDGFKRDGISRELQKTYYEQDKNKEELAKAKDIVQDLEKEARKSGALPGWLK